MYKLILFLLILLTLGCPAQQIIDPPKIYPPTFAIGDLVSVIDSPGNECGYIINLDKSKVNNWRYQIMFQNQQMYYLENEITLVKRAVWYDENKIIEMAETSNEKYFNFLEESK